MRCLIDTNVLFSAALKPGSVPDKAFAKACTMPDSAFICDYSLEELRRTFQQKFPKFQDDLEKFIEAVQGDVAVIHADNISIKHGATHRLRDLKDAPILDAAIENDIDIIVSGDKDFIVLELDRPKTVTPADFLENY
jgi:putative PIN family toxin of toxin-antitoxin system